MIRHIYIEEAVVNHPRTRAIRARFPDAQHIVCERYGEVFNVNAQNFRLQKKQPALILAAKHEARLMATPSGYGIGGRNNYYFSHMLNCLYDCRYCFLQGMYRSAHYVVFVNYEDFFADITALAARHQSDPAWFFSGYDCDSLAMEPVTRFIGSALEHFDTLAGGWLEIRTKSTQIRSLLDRSPVSNCVVAFSFTPQEISSALEHKVPSVNKRIAAMVKLQRLGWRLGIRLDPLIYSEDFESIYRQLIEQLFGAVDCSALHSVSFGSFRLPKDFFKRMIRLHPREQLFAGRLWEQGAMVSYESELEIAMRQFVTAELLKYVDQSVLFGCEWTGVTVESNQCAGDDK